MLKITIRVDKLEHNGLTNILGETTLLVPEVYWLSAIGPLSLKWALMVPLV